MVGIKRVSKVFVSKRVSIYLLLCYLCILQPLYGCFSLLLHTFVIFSSNPKKYYYVLRTLLFLECILPVVVLLFSTTIIESSLFIIHYFVIGKHSLYSFITSLYFYGRSKFIHYYLRFGNCRIRRNSMWHFPHLLSVFLL